MEPAVLLQPRARRRLAAAAFLGLEEGAHHVGEHLATSSHLFRKSNGIRLNRAHQAGDQPATSFHLLKSDFNNELCGSGEAIRLNPDGIPYLVDTKARHDSQLGFALIVALVTLVGSGAAAVSFGMSQAKSRQAAGSDDGEEDDRSSAASGVPKAKAKAKAKGAAR
eukprot:TRINITY_DN8485_c0_g3_i1.p1 TRINITY_DN8485_c0_g3~~TRINITY_DN8485_c0_g3_i1.p1  ORF type:complete len:176 (-),score=31.19 TRINITY_DN8485_c0_g3_i1:99-596(-)